MKIHAGNKEVELQFKARKMERFGDEYGKGDTQLFLNNAAYEGALKPLAALLRYFSDEFKNDDAAYDFIDLLQDDGNKIADIYAMIFEGINERGFFTQPLEVSEVPPIREKALMQTLMKEMSSKEGLAEMMKSQIGAKSSEANKK